MTEHTETNDEAYTPPAIERREDVAGLLHNTTGSYGNNPPRIWHW